MEATPRRKTTLVVGRNWADLLFIMMVVMVDDIVEIGSWGK